MSDAGPSWVFSRQPALPVGAGLLAPVALIGQIFFSTDKSDIEADGAIQLDGLVNEYLPVLNAALGPVQFRFEGFADFRDSPKGNDQLSADRAQTVRDYIGDRLNHPNFGAEVIARGEHVLSQGLKPDATLLAAFRRVDIYAPPIPIPLPSPPQDVPIPALHGTLFQVTLTNIGGGGFGVGGLAFQVQLDDLTNSRRMFFRFLGVSLKLDPKPGADVAFPSDLGPQKFSTRFPVKLESFEGITFFWSVRILIGTASVIHFVGPVEAGADSVFVPFVDAGFGVGDDPAKHIEPPKMTTGGLTPLGPAINF